MRNALIWLTIAVTSGGVGVFVGVLITSRHVLDREAAEHNRGVDIELARRNVPTPT